MLLTVEYVNANSSLKDKYIALLNDLVKQLEDDLIAMTRDLAGAGDVATGSIDPEQASGRAILAVQQAQRSPMTEQKEECKDVVENVALVWLEYLIVHSVDGIKMEQEVDLGNGEKRIQVVTVPQTVLQQLQATVKVDITPKSPYDRFARLQALDNMLQGGYFRADKVGELRIFATIVSDDDPVPKREILEACDIIEAQQIQIAKVQARQQAMQMRANQFINSDVQSQAQQMAEIQAQMQGGMPTEEMPQEVETEGDM